MAAIETNCVTSLILWATKM